MTISPKQLRQYRLIVLLSTGKPVRKDALFQEMECSEPTFTRDLREIREEFQADIKFNKATSKYQLTSKGTLTAKLLRHMREVLTVREQAGLAGSASAGVILDKEGKKPVSLSLRLTVIRKIDSYAIANGLNRSQVVEWLAEEVLGVRKK